MTTYQMDWVETSRQTFEFLPVHTSHGNLQPCAEPLNLVLSAFDVFMSW